MPISLRPSVMPAKKPWRYIIALLTYAFLFNATIFTGSSSAGLFDSFLYASCEATGGEPDGCTCTEKVIHDTFDAAFIPIIETHMRGDMKEKNEQLEALGFLGKSKFGAEIYQFAGTAAYQCSGAKLFILQVSETMPW